jgi:predicted RNase H-like nuclease
MYIESTMQYIGTDVSKGYWFTVALDNDQRWELGRFKTIEQLWKKYSFARIILIDIPVGLLDDGTAWRSCDLEARQYLKSRRNSVFMVPCRQAISASTHKEANTINKQVTGNGLSIQTWSILLKIREVDDFLSQSTEARKRIKEIHPELCFWALNDKTPMKFKKKDVRGFEERLKLLSYLHPSSKAIFKHAMTTYLRKVVARDDILDAMVAAITASNLDSGLSTVPIRPKIDSHELPMQMIYYTP